MTMKKIGITGGIGSGKTFIARIIEAMGYPIYYADSRAKFLLVNNREISEGVALLIDEKNYENGKLNLNHFAKLIFNDEQLRKKINALIHPIVRADFNHWASLQTQTIVFNEAAILFETGAHHFFDATLLVISPKDLRIQRVMKRDNCTREEVLIRMAAQWSDEQKSSLATFQINNDSVSPLLIQVEKVLEKISALNKYHH